MISTTTTASLDRTEEWKRTCVYVMGFEWVDKFEEPNNNNSAFKYNNEEDSGHGPIQQFINLTDDDQFDDDFVIDNDCDNVKTTDLVNDSWSEMVIRISNDLNRMASWIRSKQREYIDLNMTDSEASVIQTTVTSFAATTVSELEALREMIAQVSTRNSNDDGTVNNLAQHRSGIVQILLDRLQKDITKPFGILQKQRTRIAVQIWQNPLQCQLYQPSQNKKKKKRVDSIFDDDDDDDNGTQPGRQQFIPRQMKQQEEGNAYDFISKYASRPTTAIPSNPPEFLVRVRLSKRHKSAPLPLEDNQSHRPTDFSTAVSLTEAWKGNLNQTPKTALAFDVPKSQQPTMSQLDYQEQLQEDLQEEAVRLETALIASNELDSVKQMEQRMVEITTLIGQFSTLVQEQQEQIVQVHDTAQETKDNIAKGQENLVDATERTKRSKHYKAWVVFVRRILGTKLEMLEDEFQEEVPEADNTLAYLQANLLPDTPTIALLHRPNLFMNMIASCANSKKNFLAMIILSASSNIFGGGCGVKDLPK